VARQLVIELVGKADKFTKTLGDAEGSTKSFGDKIEGAGKKMSMFVSVPIAGFLAAGTKAAMDDAAAQDHLATTLANTIGNSQALVKQVEDYITKAQKVSTFTDDELRPAFEMFATTTHNVGDSQRLLGIAMDVAAGKHIDLQTAATAVAKAQEGNLAAANKLVPGLIDVKDKTMTADQAVASLARTFNGQAIGATETTAGKMQMLKRDLGETSEKIGAALLPALDKLAGFLTGTLMPGLDKISGGNGALILLGAAAAGPVMQNIFKLKDAIILLNAHLDATAVKAAGALGALGLVIQGIATVKRDMEKGGFFHGILGPSPISRKLDDLIGRASGGPVNPLTPYVIGEHGPELFVPKAAGNVIPAGRWGVGGAGGGGGAPVIVNVAGSVVTERRLIDAIHEGLLRKQRQTPLGLAG
jgi:hypothetical protein